MGGLTYVPATPTQPGFSIGSRNGNTGNQPANMQDVALYSRALTLAEIETHYSAAVVPPTLTITGITAGPGAGAFTITGTASPSAKVAVFKSTNVAAPLGSWTEVTNATPASATGTAFSFVVPQTPGETHAFYTLKVIP